MALTDAELRIVKAHARNNRVQAMRSTEMRTAPAGASKSKTAATSVFGARTADASLFGSTREFGAPAGQAGAGSGFARLTTPRELPPLGVRQTSTPRELEARN